MHLRITLPYWHKIQDVYKTIDDSHKLMRAAAGTRSVCLSVCLSFSKTYQPLNQSMNLNDFISGEAENHTNIYKNHKTQVYRNHISVVLKSHGEMYKNHREFDDCLFGVCLQHCLYVV
jgi:hypothetical protein